MRNLKFNLIFFVYLITGIHCLCDKIVSIDITDGFKQGTNIIKEGITYDNDNYFWENGTAWGCVCNFKKCVRKCCPENYEMLDHTCVQSNKELHFSVYNGIRSIELTLNDFYFLYSQDCLPNLDRIEPDSPHDLYLQKDGTLLVFNFKQIYNVEDYCIDIFDNQSFAFICVGADTQLDPEHCYTIGKRSLFF